MKSNFLTIAEPLIQRGWYVFPLKGKEPLVKGGFKSATIDMAQIEEWAKQFPKANVGIATGQKSNLFVVDVDNAAGKEGLDNWNAFCDSADVPVDTFTVQTGNGFHLYYQLPPGAELKNSTGRIAKNIDTRGDGGYVVGPGSIHPDTGEAYQILNDTHPVPLPDSIIQSLSKPKHEPAKPQQSASILPFKGGNTEKYCQKVLEASCDEVASRPPKTDRNAVLNAKAYLLGRYVGGGYMDENTVFNALYDAATLNGLVSDPDDGPASVRKTINSGLSKGKTDPKVLNLQSTPSATAKVSKKSPEPKEVFPASDPSAPKFLQTETGLADRLIYHHGKDLKHNFAHSWLLWDGKRWQPGAEKEVQEHVKAIVKDLFDEVKTMTSEAHDAELRAIGIESEGGNSKTWRDLAASITLECKSLRSYARQMNGLRAVRAAVTLANSDPVVSVDPEDFDQADWLLNVDNGTIDLQTGKLAKHSRENLLTKVMPIEYKEVDTPVWDQFLMDIFNNDQDLIDYIYRALGYSLTGSNREQCLFICYGSGSNGKSVFMTAVQNILGSYAIETHPETIMMSGRNNPGQASEGTARLAGSRFVSVNEIEQGQRFDEAKIKSLTGGDRIIARNLYKSSFEFVMKGKIWMRTNYKPEFRGVDEGITRRMTEIPFTVTIPPEKKDLNLSEKLRKEYPGILAKMVKGCLEWQKSGLDAPNIVKEATREYLAEQDFMGAFLAEIMPDGMREIRSSDMFSQYERWAAETGRPAMTQTRFGKLLNQKGWSTRKSDGNIMRVPPNSGTVQGQLKASGTVKNDSHQLSLDIQPSVFTGDKRDSRDSILVNPPKGFLISPLITPNTTIPTVPKKEKEEYKNSSIIDFNRSGTVENGKNNKNTESQSLIQNMTGTVSGTDRDSSQSVTFDEAEVDQAAQFVTQMLDDQRQFELVQMCKAIGLGDKWPAVRLIQAKDFTKDNWAIRVWRSFAEAVCAN